jgi:predicted DNA-binding transcriptional regulator AlpA
MTPDLHRLNGDVQGEGVRLGHPDPFVAQNERIRDMKTPGTQFQSLPHSPVATRDDCIVRIKGVQHLSGLGRTATYELVSRADFPEAIPLTKSARGWWRSEVLAYLNALRASSIQN